MFEAIDRAASLQPQPSPDEDLYAELLRRQEEDQTVRLVPTAPSSIPPAFGLPVDLAERVRRPEAALSQVMRSRPCTALVSPPVVRVICLSVL